MLNDEFLDKEFIIDETLKNILKAMPSAEHDAEFTNIKMFISEIRSYLHELQKYNVDFLTENTAGNIFVSHVILNKLPKLVIKELINRTHNNYPTLGDIFDNYKDVLKSLSRTSTYSQRGGKSNRNNEEKTLLAQGRSESAIPTVKNFESVVTWPKNSCKLCNSSEHTIGKCDNFVGYEAKIARLIELSLCIRCAGSGHSESECYGKKGKLRFQCVFCKKREHISPLCPKQKAPTSTKVNLCYALKNIEVGNILPTMTLALKNGKKYRKTRCLVDCGSQRSYLVKKASIDLCSSYEALYNIEHDVHTYIGQETKGFKQMSTGVKIGNKLFFIPLLVDEHMDIRYELPGMNLVVDKLKAQKVPFADESFYENRNHENVEIEMLIGIDIIQHFSLSMINCVGGNCLHINNKVAPVGNIFNFLNSDQCRNLIKAHAKPVQN